jgi:hypothetical protein
MIGGAFYSRGFGNTTGPGMAASGPSSDKTWEAGSVDYNKLPLPGATEFNDPESKAAFSALPIAVPSDAIALSDSADKFKLFSQKLYLQGKKENNRQKRKRTLQRKKSLYFNIWWRKCSFN